MNNGVDNSKVLIVDDVALNRKLQKAYLDAVGYDVILAEDGVDALKKVSEEPPDLVLLDVVMPKMNGFQVCQRLKTDEKTRFIPVILVTALNEISDKIKGIEAGADDFISKPFNKLELLARVKSLLRIKHLHDKLERKIKELEITQKKLYQLAITDGLTGLYNYRFFNEQLAHEILRAKRHDLKVSVVMLDIDFFKNFNDTHGHPAGDQVLKTIGRLLNENIRKIDFAARYGGEEFALILIETNKNAAAFVSNKLKDLVENYPFFNKESQPNGKLTISMGVATYPDDSEEPQKLVDLADSRLYKAKEMGRNRVVME
ncbi:MAG: diguanylate cyclase [candidate division KSB1 bacterium]|jgi:diguanylate cyclase (GGDEF)-like protein|nr:diguanylate cyclase [candidate division KSB1 bacterium]